MPTDLLTAVQGFYTAFETGDVASLDGVFHADWTDHTLPPGRAPGLEGMKGAITGLRQAVPDLSFERVRALQQGEQVAVHGRFTGTHTGPFNGLPASGSAIDFIIFDIHHVQDGRIAESWHLEDNLTVLTQMGAIPPLG